MEKEEKIVAPLTRKIAEKPEDRSVRKKEGK